MVAEYQTLAIRRGGGVALTVDQIESQISLSGLTVRTVIVHTITYFIAGLLAYTLGHAGKGWLNWTLGVAFSIVMLLPILGLVVGDR